MNTHERYQQLYTEAGSALRQSFEQEHNTKISEADVYAADLDGWCNVLGNRREKVLIESAARDLQHSALMTAMAMYRAGFSALRLSLEKILGAVLLSANELDLRLRLAGVRDLNWAPITDLDRGVFSPLFARAFFPELETHSITYHTIACRTYRACSEFVHGDPQADSTLPQKIEHDQANHERWSSLFTDMQLATTYALALRYLADLPSTQPISESLELIQHIAPIRNKIAG